MELRIINSNESKIVSIAWIEINTPVGNFVIQRGHAPMIIALQPQQPVIFRLANGKQDTLLISQGIIEITRDTATILINE
jgi:F0F1-type ATP synthase epsilon subunit